MSKNSTPITQPQNKDFSLLHSDVLLRLFGGDAMQALRCGICMEFFEVPIVLPCGHTFCLQCLTEMCKHAFQSSVLCPIQDLRIACPQCRVLIYASPILDRNITCNFVIQSVIECLRARPVEKKNHKATNTDEARLGSTVRLVGDIEMDQVIKEVDRLSEAIGNRSVLDLAYFEVDEIRRQHIRSEETKSKEQEELGWIKRHPWESFDDKKSSSSQHGCKAQQLQCQNLFQMQHKQQQPIQNYQGTRAHGLPSFTNLSKYPNTPSAMAPISLPSAPFVTPTPFVPSSSSITLSSNSSSTTSTTPLAVPASLTSFRQQPKTFFVLPAHQQQHQQQKQQQHRLVQRLEQPQPIQNSPHHLKTTSFKRQTQMYLLQKKDQSLHQSENSQGIQYQQHEQHQQPQLQHLRHERQQQYQGNKILRQPLHQYKCQTQPSASVDIGQTQSPIIIGVSPIQPSTNVSMGEAQTSSTVSICQIQPNTNRMATVQPVQRSISAITAVCEPNPPSQSVAATPLVVQPRHIVVYQHPSHLDNDPAVMSYSYSSAAGDSAPSTSPASG